MSKNPEKKQESPRTKFRPNNNSKKKKKKKKKRKKNLNNSVKTELR